MPVLKVNLYTLHIKSTENVIIILFHIRLHHLTGGITD